MKELIKKMLDDLDRRYVPIANGEVKKIKFDKYVLRGDRGNRHLHLHKYLFYASFVDPRTKNKLKKRACLEFVCLCYHCKTCKA